MFKYDSYDIDRDVARWEESMDMEFYNRQRMNFVKFCKIDTQIKHDIQDMFGEHDGITDVDYLVNNTRLGRSGK